MEKRKITVENKEKYSRKCPECGKTIYYTWKSDYYMARKKDSKCKKCSLNTGKFVKGCIFNEKYLLRENSLDKLLEETPESFYWIGFLIADGSFYKNTFEFTLSEKDKTQLEKFAKFIGFIKELSYREKTKSYRLSFNNKNSIPFIMDKYGIVRNKTYNPIDFSKFENYPKDLLLSMLIGIIDGDGSIIVNKNAISFNISITAYNSWVKFYEKLLSVNEINGNINKINKTNCINIRIGKKNEIKKLINIINENKLPVLIRKWEKIDYSNSKYKK